MGRGTKRLPQAVRRQQILDAAYQEFSARGYSRASTASIARQANASKETLYGWFGNKAQLFSAVFQSRLDRMTGHSADAIAQGVGPDKVLQAIAADTIRFALAVAPLSRAIAAEGPEGQAMTLAAALIAEERQRFAAHLCRWRDMGLLAFSADPLELVSLFVSMAQGEWAIRLASAELDNVTDAMIEGHARLVTDVFLHGLATPAAAPS